MAGPTRWGIASTGKISHDFVSAILMTSEFENQVAAVAARSLSSAEQFNEDFNNVIPRVYGSYEELAQDHNVDVVYVGNINPAHYNTVMMMLAARKNVLVEKPMAMNVKQTRTLIDKAREKNVFYMEGFWSRFFPIYSHLRGELACGSIGDVRTVNINFGFDGRDRPRLMNKEYGGGAIMDIGCYAIMFATLLYKERPQRISTTGILAQTGTDLCSHSTLWYSGDRVAQLNVAVDRALDNTAVIMGTEGAITIPNFWNPIKMITPSKTYDCPLPKPERSMNYPRGEGFIYEINALRECLVKGEKECSLMPLEDSLIISEVLVEIRKQLGLAYPEDES